MSTIYQEAKKKQPQQHDKATFFAINAFCQPLVDSLYYNFAALFNVHYCI